jgi:DNA repair exonuclease SbcCD ATPase subunit
MNPDDRLVINYRIIFLFLNIIGSMNKYFKPNERDLIKVATFFKKQSRKLIAEGKVGEENKKVEEAVDRFIEHLNNHANTRAFILEQREYLKKLVKDNPQCPQCRSRDMLKPAGTEKNEKGWKSNRYKCRRCNIVFTWNMPNNPWDMIEYIQEVLQTLRAKKENEQTTGKEKQEALDTIASMQANLDKLKPVIDAHDREYNDLQKREEEMDKLIHEFRNSLLIEKIKMDTWESRRK